LLIIVQGITIPAFELILIMIPFIAIGVYFYKKSLAKSKAAVIYLYPNGTADQFPATEYMGEHKLEVHFSKKESKDFAIDGLPLEIRIGPVKRLRTYFIRDGSPKTLDTRIFTQVQPIGIMDVTTEVFYDAMNKMKTFTAALASGVFDNMKYHIPWAIGGVGGGFAVAFLITSLFG